MASYGNGNSVGASTLQSNPFAYLLFNSSADAARPSNGLCERGAGRYSLLSRATTASSSSSSQTSSSAQAYSAGSTSSLSSSVAGIAIAASTAASVTASTRRKVVLVSRSAAASQQMPFSVQAYSAGSASSSLSSSVSVGERRKFVSEDMDVDSEERNSARRKFNDTPDEAALRVASGIRGVLFTQLQPGHSQLSVRRSASTDASLLSISELIDKVIEYAAEAPAVPFAHPMEGIRSQMHAAIDDSMTRSVVPSSSSSSAPLERIMRLRALADASFGSGSAFSSMSFSSLATSPASSASSSASSAASISTFAGVSMSSAAPLLCHQAHSQGMQSSGSASSSSSSSVAASNSVFAGTAMSLAEGMLHNPPPRQVMHVFVPAPATLPVSVLQHFESPNKGLTIDVLS